MEEGREKILPKLKIKPCNAVSYEGKQLPLSMAASPFMPASQYWLSVLAAWRNINPEGFGEMLAVVSSCPTWTFQYSRDTRHLLGRPEMKPVSLEDGPLPYSVIKVCHTFSMIGPKRNSDLKCDRHYLATRRLFLCKAWFHPLINMRYCETLSEIFLQLWRYVLKIT